MDAENVLERMVGCMIAGDRTGAAQIVTEAIAHGKDQESILIKLLDPALIQIGELWSQEKLSMAQAFVSAKIAEDTLKRCLKLRTTSKPPFKKGVFVIGNIEEDFHSLGRSMVVTFMQVCGWTVHDLGNDVTAPKFIENALKVGARVIGVSAMTRTTALNIRKVRDLMDERGLSGQLKLAVGGAVFNWRPELVAEVGGDGTAVNAMRVDALVTRLQDEAMGRISA
jgi:methanogenic corrinoid protein MtbC1